MGADLILWDDWSISLREQKAWTSPRGMEIQLPSDSGPAEGEECKDLKEMGHHFLPGCVCSWWVVDQTPTCCPWSPGALYCRKLQLCCGLHNVPPEKCFIEQHYRRVTEYSYNNFHVNLHVMLHLSTLKCCSRFLTMASSGLCRQKVWECCCSEGLLRVSLQASFLYGGVWDAEQGNSRTLLPSSAAQSTCFNNQWQQQYTY